MAYAHDLARSYARQKRMAQYLPGDLRDRISWEGSRIASERRYVTVLFADLVGFTRLASRLDAEEVFCLMNACFEHIVAHILTYGGVIDRFIGDAVMALFGAPMAHEDHSERAVRAALDMRAKMEVFSQEMESALGLFLQLHIGIHSGDVIAGSVGVDDHLSYTVTGDTVNLAYRLQELAEAGNIYVSEAVYRQTQHMVEHEYLGEHVLKGFEAPVPVFAAQDEKDPSS
jgi:class 3 adenylate cyclase